MTENGVRPGAVAVVFAIALAVIGVALYLWWPAGVAAGLVFGIVATVVIGRRLQDQDALVPTDDELLERLGGVPARDAARVVRTVWEPARRPASIR